MVLEGDGTPARDRRRKDKRTRRGRPTVPICAGPRLIVGVPLPHAPPSCDSVRHVPPLAERRGGSRDRNEGGDRRGREGGGGG
ncbi:hypothetical protein CCS92_34545, partial [Methylobacterium radiotolerans]